MTENLNWWPVPTEPDQIEAYIEKKFSLSGENVWIKLLRASIEKHFCDKLKVKEPKVKG